MASLTVRIFSACSSGISMSKASSKAITSSTVSSESAPRSSTNDALGVTSPSSTPSCSTMICFTRSSTDAMRPASSFSRGQPCRRIALLLCLPVSTALRLCFGVRVDIGNRILNGADFLRVLVRNLNVEGLLKGHHQLHRVQRVGAKVVHKRSLGRHFRFIHAQLLHDDLLCPFINRCHKSLLLSRAGGNANSSVYLLAGIPVKKDNCSRGSRTAAGPQALGYIRCPIHPK